MSKVDVCRDKIFQAKRFLPWSPTPVRDQSGLELVEMICDIDLSVANKASCFTYDLMFVLLLYTRSYCPNNWKPEQDEYKKYVGTLFAIKNGREEKLPLLQWWRV